MKWGGLSGDPDAGNTPGMVCGHHHLHSTLARGMGAGAKAVCLLMRNVYEKGRPMSKRRPPLSPYPLRVLLGRIAQEWETRHRIFDMPTGRFFHSDPGLDLSVPVFGTRASTPVGPAAGPHTQLAATP